MAISEGKPAEDFTTGLLSAGGLDKIVLGGPSIDEDFLGVIRDISNVFKEVGNLDKQGRRTADSYELIGVFRHMYGPVYSPEKMEKAIGMIQAYAGTVQQASPSPFVMKTYLSVLTPNPESDPE